jgi:ATP-binding cassette subfamily F protein 3
MQQVAPAHIDSPFRFQFPAPGKTSDPLLILDHAEIGYGSTSILKGVSLSLCPGDRIGLLGKNGAGKSTLLKSITGSLPLIAGDRVCGSYLRIGYFDQQQLEVLDLDASPQLHLQRLTPAVREQEILDFLGGFNFRGDQATSCIRPFSGGEKARLALAMVVWQDPNLLILDEPTNHLDLEMRHALEMALQGYTGAILLVSHDRHLLRNVTEELLLVDDGRVTAYDDDISSYERWILSANSSNGETTPAEAIIDDPPLQSVSRKDARQQAAELRARLRPIQQKINETEQSLTAAQEKLAALQAQLADGDIYSEQRKAELADLLQQEGQTKLTIERLEQQWLEYQEALEVAEGSQ